MQLPVSLTVHTLTLDGNKSFIFPRMKQDGWCPWRLLEFGHKLNRSTLAFVSNFKRPDNLRHDRCSQSGCAFGQLNQEDYQTKHADECSGCSDVVADEGYIYLVLKSGFFPLITSINESNRDQTIKLISSDSKPKFVAISHVWSDGLGNLQRNAIPKCQLSRLSMMVRSIPGKTISDSFFWLDTICCPPKDGDAQNLAIGMMRDTYEQANEVLVLDSFLLKQAAKPLNDAEVLLRINCSGWTGRLWTLQEGALARSLFFQFSDGPYDLNEGLYRLDQNTDIVFQNTLQSSITKQFFEMRQFTESFASESVKLIALMKSLRFRCTSVLSDEPVCLATMLGLDTLRIVKAPSDKRMLLLWSLIKEIPAEIIFLAGEKLEVDGYRWAPRSFLRQSVKENTQNIKYVDHYEISNAQRGVRGLSVQFPGFALLYEWQDSIGQTFYIRDEHKVWYLVTTDMQYSGLAKSYEQPLDECDHIIRASKIDPFLLPDKSSPQLMLVLRHQATKHTSGLSEGILVIGVSQENQMTYVRSLCGVQIHQMTNAEQALNIHALEKSIGDIETGKAFCGIDARTKCLLLASAVQLHQKWHWCVD